ncbi:hypothetical protein QL285_093541 [Trifolium repens]|nr:hypothetical protein QL285_093541 [Trifolium repens]
MLGSYDNNGWAWRFVWSDVLSVDEAELAQELLHMLIPIRPCTDMKDRRKWIPAAAANFSVKSAYLDLLNRLVLPPLDDSKLISLGRMWKNNVPSKISIFGWRLLLEKLPTRESLFSKGVITNVVERVCVLCCNHVETTPHIFLQCHASNSVWLNVFK